MQFLKKNPVSALTALRYSVEKERAALREGLLKEQHGFCAYTERYVKSIDSCHVEHFYPKADYPHKEDEYDNLYTVLAWINEHKAKKIEPFLPILEPHAADLHARIVYENGIYSPVEKEDDEADNLIKFLGLNKNEVYEDRRKHLSRVKQLKAWRTEDEFLAYLKKHVEELSFATALEKELGIPAMRIILEISVAQS